MEKKVYDVCVNFRQLKALLALSLLKHSKWAGKNGMIFKKTQHGVFGFAFQI